MSILQVIILGVVEGVTEFLPISSTAHLIIVSKILGIPQTQFQKFFEVFIQSGAILAVVFLYFRYILKHTEVLRNIIVSFIPTAIVGLFLHKIIKEVFFESQTLIALAFLIIGVIFIVVEKLIKDDKIVLAKNLAEINIYQAIIIGLGQSLAVVPGVSRAGAVIISMMILGFKRKDSALYSFLLAVPTILAASAFDLYKTKDVILISQGNLINLTIGFLTSFIGAYIVIKWFIDYLRKNSLVPFGIYRIILAIILLGLP